MAAGGTRMRDDSGLPGEHLRRSGEALFATRPRERTQNLIFSLSPFYHGVLALVHRDSEAV